MSNLNQQLEALLFVATGPLSIADLAEQLQQPAERVEAELVRLEKLLGDRGIRLSRHQEGVELVTAPELATVIAPFVASEHARPLSASSLETLAITLYRQPVTRAEIEEIRGVSSDQSLANLLQRGLISKAGARKEPGRPMQYRASAESWRILGLTDASQLPPIEEPEVADAP